MTEQVVKQIRGQYLHVAAYHHRSVWGDMNSLRDSIAEEGIIVPLLVRERARKDGGGYEIVHGVRRHRAGDAAGLKTFPCIVADIDEEDAIAKQRTENAQRQDIHPIDDALYCEELHARGLDNDAIAKRLHLKKRDVVRLMRLLGLTPASRKAYVAGRFDHEDALSLSRVDGDKQKDILAALDAGTLQREEITGYIQREFSAQLDDVPWRKSDAELVPKAGACTTCSKRSDVQKDLFNSELTGLRCLDVDCWRSKMAATYQIRASKEGQAILDQQPGDLFAMVAGGGRPVVLRSSGMVDADTQCQHVIGHLWREAVTKSVRPDAEAPTEYLAKDQDGRPRFLYRESIVTKLVKKSDIAREQAEERAAADPVPHEALAGPNPRSESRIRRAVIQALAEKAVAVDHDTWPWVAERIVDGATARAVGLAATLLADSIAAMELVTTPEGKAGLIALAQTSNRQARRVATAVLVFDEGDIAAELGPQLRALAQLCEADLADIEREIRSK